MKIPNSYAFGQALRASGWKRPSSSARALTMKDFTTFIKRVGGVWVEALVSNSMWSDQIFLLARASGRFDLTDEQQESLRTTLRFNEDTVENTIALVEREAKRIAATAKALSAPRKRDYSRLSYDVPGSYGSYFSDDAQGNSFTGKAALDAWKERIEAKLLEAFPRQAGMHDTRWWVENMLENYVIEPPIGLSRAEVGRQIRAVLEKLAKRGEIEKCMGGTTVEWARQDKVE